MSSETNLETGPKVYGEWLNGTDAAEIVGCSEQQIPKLAKLGYIGTQQLPGNLSRRKYSREDCYKTKELSVKKATVAEPANE